MATTIKGLKTAFKKTNRRVEKAFSWYKKSKSKLYMCNYTGRIRNVKEEVFRPDGSIRNFAIDLMNESLSLQILDKSSLLVNHLPHDKSSN